MAIAIVCYLASAVFMLLNISSITGNSYVGKIGIIMTGIIWISIALAACVIYSLANLYLGPLIECARHGTSRRGKYVPKIFDNYDDYCKSMETFDGRFELVLQTANYMIIQESLKFFSIITHYSVAIWLIWSFITSVFYNSYIIIFYAGVVAILQIKLLEKAENQLYTIARTATKKEKTI